MTEFRIHIDSRDGSKSRDLTDLKSVDFALEHTALSDWEAVVPYDPPLEDYIFGDVYLYADHPDGTSDLLFRGYLETVHSDERAAESRIGGRDIVRDLTDEGLEVTYKTIKTHEAIRDFWKNYTNFDYRVYQPDYQVVEGVQVQSADTSTDFSNIFTQGANQPVIVNNGALEAARTFFYEQAEDASDTGAYYQIGGNVASDNYDDRGEAIALQGVGDDVSFSFTPNYDVPASNHAAIFRLGNPNGAINDGHELDIKINGTVVSGTALGFSLSSKWSWLELGSASSDLAGGSTHSVTIEVVNTATDDVYIDIIGLYDTRFNYNLDNQVNADYALAGPELYPDAVQARLSQANSSYNIVGATIKNTNFNDLSNGQAIAVSYDGGTNWISASNTDYLDDDQRGAATTTIDSRITLSRFGSRSTGTTPTTGFKPQRAEKWNLYIDGSTESTIEDQTFEGNLLDILQDMHEYGGLRFHVEYLENSKKVYTYARGQNQLQQNVNWTVNNRTRSVDVRDYANHVTVRGEIVNGSRPTTTVKSDSEIQTHGKKHFDEINPSLSNSSDVKSRARTLLANKQRQDQLKATLDIVPMTVTPGPDYLVEWPDGTSDYLTLETVRFNERRGQAEGKLEFDPYIDFVGEILSQKRELRNTQDAT